MAGYLNESLTPPLASYTRPALCVDIDVELYVPTVEALAWMLRNGLLVPGVVVDYDVWNAVGEGHGGGNLAHEEVLVKWGATFCRFSKKGWPRKGQLFQLQNCLHCPSPTIDLCVRECCPSKHS